MRAPTPNKRFPGKVKKSYQQYRRSGGRGRSAPESEARPDRDARKLLKQIGIPEAQPFVPDDFQLEAVEKVMLEDVLVSAPTGSGKTWIALEAIKAFLAQGAHTWYATPLKALSNAKFEEFGEALGRDQVGILTGDRKENPDAPVIVGTTEILRNQLYDAMHMGVDLPLDLVVLDEAHYLGDKDRGVVWEEVLIYLPDRVRLLLLSATISNATTVAEWLSHMRGAPCSVVHAQTRPVPLHVLLASEKGELTPFLQGKRITSKADRQTDRPKDGKRIREPQSMDMNLVMDTLRSCDLVPAIVFLKSRAECDRALQSLKSSPAAPSEGGFESALKAYVEPFPELRNQRRVNRLLATRAGSHHAGQLPAWRLLIEKMMVLGHLDVIFSTSTVAAGVNFPARTVVLVQSDRFNGETFVDMTATDLHQMTGRAGRRGMDKAGFVLLVPGRYMDLELLRRLFLSSPEPLESRISVNFSMVLNLLLSHDPEGAKHLLGLSFAAFHPNPRMAKKTHKDLLKRFQEHLEILQELEYIDDKGTPTYDGNWAARLRLDHPLLIAELVRQGELSGLSAQELAAVIAPFVMDKERQYLISRELWAKTRYLWKKFRRIVRTLNPLIRYLSFRGFVTPPVTFWPAAAVYLWAQDVDWHELTTQVTADEGDLAMLILRTADHLRQLLSLEEEAPELAETAARSLESLMRSPLL